MIPNRWKKIECQWSQFSLDVVNRVYISICGFILSLGEISFCRCHFLNFCWFVVYFLHCIFYIIKKKTSLHCCFKYGHSNIDKGLVPTSATAWKRLLLRNDLMELDVIYLGHRRAGCAGTAVWCRTCCRCSTLQPSEWTFPSRQRWTDLLWHYLCLHVRLWRHKHMAKTSRVWVSKILKKNPTCLYKFFLTVSMWNIFDILAQAAFLRLVLCRMGRNRLTCLLWIKVSCFFFSQKVLCVCRRRRSCRGLMDVDLLLRLQGALRAAQWKYQQQAQSCQTRHVAHPVVRL